MTDLMSMTDAARQLGLSRARLLQLCKIHGIGRVVLGRYGLTEQDLARFRRLPRPRRGRPRGAKNRPKEGSEKT